MDSSTLPVWVQLIALFGLPALGAYTGFQISFAETRGDLKRLEAITRLELDTLIEKQESAAAEVRILRKRSHHHSSLLGRLIMKTGLSSPPIEDFDEDG